MGVIVLGGSTTQFHSYGLSHWVTLLVTVAGAIGLVAVGRNAPEPITRVGCRALAVVTVGLTLGVEIHEFDPSHALHTLPLQLSDLAPYIAGVALWSRPRWASSLTAYWCLTLSSQALLTPVLRGPDFPSVSFLVFFADHILVVWAAIMLVWGVDQRPRWRDYRFSLTVTAVWAAITGTFNAIAGTDYAFLNGKPSTPSILDLLGPWPWYLLPEAGLLAVVWALLTQLWQPRSPLQPPGGPAAP